MIKTYRGLVNDGDQEQIRVKTMTGSTGYRIVKLALMPNKPVTSANESVVQIWKRKQTSFSSTIDFDNRSLLAIAVYSNQTDTTYYPDDQSVIFNQDIFNQDIFVTHTNETGAEAVNYYLELEIIDLRDNENEYITLRDIKASLPQHG